LGKKRGRVRERERARNPNAGDLLVGTVGAIVFLSSAGTDAGTGVGGRNREHGRTVVLERDGRVLPFAFVERLNASKFSFF
jgi:hypothetical protein